MWNQAHLPSAAAAPREANVDKDPLHIHFFVACL